MTPLNHIDIVASIYDRFVKSKNSTRLCDLVKLPISGLLLDVGGGTGRISHPLRNMVKRIIIADSSMGMLNQAISKGDLTAICSESEELPFLDESFERIIMVDALHHVTNYQKTVNELWRMLKPGGCIVIEEPDIRRMSTKIMAVIEKLILMRSHFISPMVIADSFPHDARVHIEKEGSTAWVVIYKQNG
jgi:demethylmenaquinone methyltransferase/2-methoxy-6-polyprenyl-1,4-benzoquinol methylase